jgi:hypothetical protein
LTVTENGGLIAGDDRGNISSMSSVEKPFWSFKTGGRISGIFEVGSHILAASHDNFVYFLKRKNGARVWKKRLIGRVARMAKINDRYALLSGLDDPGAVLIDVSNGRLAGQILVGNGEAIVATPVVGSPESKIFILTNSSASAFSLKGQAGCSK